MNATSHWRSYIPSWRLPHVCTKHYQVYFPTSSQYIPRNLRGCHIHDADIIVIIFKKNWHHVGLIFVTNNFFLKKSALPCMLSSNLLNEVAIIGFLTPLSSHSRRSEDVYVAPSPWMAEGPFSENGKPNFFSSTSEEWRILGEGFSASLFFFTRGCFFHMKAHRAWIRACE